MQTKRMHVVIPEDTVRAIDSMVGKRQRSQFIAQVLKERLQQLRIIKAIDKAAGAWKNEDHPELAGRNGTKKWIKNLREESGRQMEN